MRGWMGLPLALRDVDLGVVVDLEPSATRVEGGGLLDLAQPQGAGPEGERVVGAAGRHDDVHVVDPGHAQSLWAPVR